jgi:hypothetical protein
MLTNVSEVRAASIIRAIARTSETSVDIQLRPRQYIPEDSELHVKGLSQNVVSSVYLTFALFDALSLQNQHGERASL